jgi:hypothetical protein
MGNQVFQGTWSSNQSKLHINWLELKAVYLTVNHFLSQIKNQAVLIRSDNTTVVQDIFRRIFIHIEHTLYMHIFRHIFLSNY